MASSSKPFNAVDDDYISDEDEDYCPSANEEAEADAAFQELTSSANVQDDIQAKKAAFDPEIDKMWDEFLETSKPKKSVFAPESEDEADKFEIDEKTEEKPGGKKRKIVEVYDFFGENVTREREVDEEEAKKIEERKAKAAAEKKPKYLRVEGIEAMIKKIDKNPKMTIVDKSSLDWQRHVKKEKLEEDLQKYDKSKSSFLDNAKFAERASEAEYSSTKKS